ncbi:MAG: restriction endonuclease subunit S, partial [Bacteroidales bacterium]|nr:restriction endonuclease subunit S [Bacteroidales bacterium]
MIIRRGIKEIADIQTGVYLKETPDGEVHYLQVKDFGKDALPVLSPPSSDLNDRVLKYLLSDGNLLFAAKGFFNFCAVYREEWGKAVASSSFLVLKIKDKANVLPEYLNWILNREDVCACFQRETAGSVMPSITKAMLGEYEMDVPTMDVQHKIIAIAELQKREQVLNKGI